MNNVSGPLIEGTTTVSPETASPADEDYVLDDSLSEFQDLIGTNDIKPKIDSGIGLEELAEWCRANNVPANIALDLMKRAVESGEAFIIY
jgi:hypothetical protein